MDWSKGFSASYKAYIVDPISWRDIEEINIIGGTISKEDSNLRESADVSVLNYNSNKEEWIRVYLDARQTSSSYYGAIFTGLISSPSKDIDGVVQNNNLRCYSVLKPASDILLPKGWYISYGTNSGDALKSLLSVIKGIPIEIDSGSPGLSRTLIAENGETALSMAEKILYYIGWRLYISGDGTIVISEPNSEIKTTFNATDNDCIETRISVENNWFDCPNVFRAVDGNFSAVAKDNDSDSILSIQNRGREIWVEESGCTTNIGESLLEYAKRRLKEEQRISKHISYNRRFHPDINVSDVIAIKYPGQSIDGIFYVGSQSIEINYGATVSEEAFEI